MEKSRGKESLKGSNYHKDNNYHLDLGKRFMETIMGKERVIIIGAAGRDFHNFNMLYRNNPKVEVVAFTAAQIPGIADKRYPKELAGDLYPNGIPIYDEKQLETLIKKYKDSSHKVKCLFSYSDVSNEKLGEIASRVAAAGGTWEIASPMDTMLKSTKPVISVTATRTGCGKSQTSRAVIEALMEQGKKVVAIRHPMPYGDLAEQAVQRFATVEDLKKHKCTIEEMEEYEPHVVRGNVIYAGVDYEKILRAAEKEADVIVWDGGNNDTSFIKADKQIVVFDALRPGHELKYYHGTLNARMADVAIINKCDSATPEQIKQVEDNIKILSPKATIVKADSKITLENPQMEALIRGKKVLVVEDGPTLTHGGMDRGAGVVIAQRLNAAELVDARPFAVGKIKETYEKYPGIPNNLLPAMGYDPQQLKDLETTINNTIKATNCDAVIIGTPINLAREIKIDKPTVRVNYSLKEHGLTLKDILQDFLKKKDLEKTVVPEGRDNSSRARNRSLNFEM